MINDIIKILNIKKYYINIKLEYQIKNSNNYINAN